MPWLEDQLRALVDQECAEEWEVVVVDNGSTDESADGGPDVGRPAPGRPVDRRVPHPGAGRGPECRRASGRRRPPGLLRRR